MHRRYEPITECPRKLVGSREGPLQADLSQQDVRRQGLADGSTSHLRSGNQVYGEAEQNRRGQGGCQSLVDSGESFWEGGMGETDRSHPF
jgi:hypothetical protein